MSHDRKGARRWLFSLFLLAGLVLAGTDASAVPAFSRKYKTSCSTCHYAFPMLNGFGEAFKNNGYRFPKGGDEAARKEEPVSLGSDEYKKLWPKEIWPADIPGSIPFSGAFIGRVNWVETGAVHWNFEVPHEIEGFFNGTIGDDFSFFAEIELENEGNEVAVALPFYLQYDAGPFFHVRGGAVQSDPTISSLRLTRNYNNIVSLRTRNGWRMRDANYGFEVWGAANGPGGKGGLMYRAGAVNGQGPFVDPNNNKDVYGRLTYKLGGVGEAGGGAGGTSSGAHYVDNSVTVGAWVYDGVASAANARDEEFRLWGGDVDIWYSRFILNAQLANMKSEIPGRANRESRLYFVQGNVVAFPWLIPVVRWEWQDNDTALDTVRPVEAVVSSLQVLPRANIRFALEYKKFLDDANERNDQFVWQIHFGI